MNPSRLPLRLAEPAVPPALKVLVTGAAGFLGRAVLRHLPSRWDAVALVRTPPVLPLPGVSAAYASAGETGAHHSRFDAVLHLAAVIPGGGQSDAAVPGALDAVNVGLVAALVAAYPDARHVLASSVSVYGVPRALPLSVDSAPQPASAYGRSKLAAEGVVTGAPRHAVIRFSSLVGVGMRPGSFIPVAVSAARAGEIRLFGDGSRLQNYLDVDDAASMCVAAVLAPDSFLSLGIGPRSYSNREVAEILADLAGARIVHGGRDASPSYVYSANGSVLAGTARTDLVSSLRKMVEASAAARPSERSALPPSGRTSRSDWRADQ